MLLFNGGATACAATHDICLTRRDVAADAAVWVKRLPGGATACAATRDIWIGYFIYLHRDH